MSAQKHSPLPWACMGNAPAHLIDSEGNLVFGNAGTEVNGALIVRAVNSHADLLEALKAMVDRWEPDRGGPWRHMWEEAVAAISKAEGSAIGK
jgi:hypothetical protein